MISFRAARFVLGVLLFSGLAFAAPAMPEAAAGDRAPLDLSDYRGKIVVVDFWASWCAPCRRSFPWLDAMHEKYADDGLVIIGVNEDNNLEDARMFLKDVPVGFRIVLDADGEIASAFDLIAMPSTYIIGRDGKLAARHLGFKTAKQDEYEAVLRRLLDAAAARRDEPDRKPAEG